MKWSTFAIAAGVALASGGSFVAWKLGLFAPDFARLEGGPIEATPLVDLDGHPHTYDELRGHAITLYFWGTWCGPCLKHLASMARGHDQEAFRHVQPIAFDTDPVEVRTTLERIGYGGPMWIATGGMPLLQQRYAGNTLRAVPYEVRLDAEGRIVGASYGIKD